MVLGRLKQYTNTYMKLKYVEPTYSVSTSVILRFKCASERRDNKRQHPLPNYRVLVDRVLDVDCLRVYDNPFGAWCYSWLTLHL